MVLSRLHAYSYTDSCSAIVQPKIPISLRSGLCVSLRVWIVMSFPEGEQGKL